MLNTCVLAGNLGGDPESHFTSEGEPITSFHLAFRAGKKKTGWVKITCFGSRLSELSQKYLHKGARIAVTGSLDYSQWETSEGGKRSAIQMIAREIEFIRTDSMGVENGEHHEENS